MINKFLDIHTSKCAAAPSVPPLLDLSSPLSSNFRWGFSSKTSVNGLKTSMSFLNIYELFFLRWGVSSILRWAFFTILQQNCGHRWVSKHYVVVFQFWDGFSSSWGGFFSSKTDVLLRLLEGFFFKMMCSWPNQMEYLDQIGFGTLTRGLIFNKTKKRVKW